MHQKGKGLQDGIILDQFRVGVSFTIPVTLPIWYRSFFWTRAWSALTAHRGWGCLFQNPSFPLLFLLSKADKVSSGRNVLVWRHFRVKKRKSLNVVSTSLKYSSAKEEAIRIILLFKHIQQTRLRKTWECFSRQCGQFWGNGEVLWCEAASACYRSMEPHTWEIGEEKTLEKPRTIFLAFCIDCDGIINRADWHYC